MNENPMTTTSPVINWECKNNLGTIHPPLTCPTIHPGFPKYTYLKNFIIRAWGRKLYCDHHLCTPGSPDTVSIVTVKNDAYNSFVIANKTT